jgi:hypothetical protein
LRYAPAAVALLVAGLALAGCGSSQKAASGAPPCPKVAVLSDAAHLTVYRDGPGRDLTDVVFEAELGRIAGDCVYKKRNTSVTVEMKLAVVARRGPADRDRAAVFEYFVAIVDSQSNVLARQEFRSQVTFRPEQTQLVSLEELEQVIPLKRDQPGSDFDVLIGFKLTPEQVERNRGRSE